MVGAAAGSSTGRDSAREAEGPVAGGESCMMIRDLKISEESEASAEEAEVESGASSLEAWERANRRDLRSS